MRALFAVALVACNHAQPPAVSIATLPTASATVTPVIEARVAKASADDGDFSSDRGGMVHLVAEPNGALAGTYTNGVLTCDASLACRWYESSSEGRATFRRKQDGTLDGTWGSAESDDDGGSWTLVPVKRTGALDGVWDTNWGVATIATTRAGVHVDYADGQMECTERNNELACTWAQGSANGGAKLAIETSRVLRGHWGNDASMSDGGAWVFVRR